MMGSTEKLSYENSMMKITVYMFIQQPLTLIMINDNETMMVTVMVKMQMKMTMYIVYAT